MILYEIPVIDAPHQRLDTVLNDTPVSLTLLWNEWAKRWSLSLEKAGEAIIQGKRLVPDVDLIAGLGLGRLFLVDWAGKGGEPGRTELPAGEFRLISAV